MQPNNLLDQLKDIYLPQEVSSWWPLAYGWWVVFGLIVFVGVLFLIYLQIRKRQKQYVESIVDDFKASVTDTYISKPKEVLQTISVYLNALQFISFQRMILNYYTDKIGLITLIQRLKLVCLKEVLLRA